MYNIILTPVVKRYLKKIKEKTLLLKYKTIISKIQRQPYDGEIKAGYLSRIYCMAFRYSGAKYEVAYKIYEEDNPVVIIMLANKRENFYEQLKRYL